MKKLNIVNELSDILTDVRLNRDDAANRIEDVIHSIIAYGGSHKKSEWLLSPRNCPKNNPSHTPIVCEEIIRKDSSFPYLTLDYPFNNYSLTCRQKIINSLTIIIKKYEKTLVKKIQKLYPGINIIISSSSEEIVEEPDVIVSKSSNWNELIKLVNTPYVLIARNNLNNFGNWTNLERSLRNLDTKSKHAFAVGGSVRDSTTGYWRTGCYQINIEYYHFKIREGYFKSTCDDCMICDYVTGPFVTKKEYFEQTPLLTTDEETMFLNWFYEMEYKTGKSSLLCPDILYNTNGFSSMGEINWLELGRHVGFQSVTTDHSPKILKLFDCEEVNLECNPRKQTESFFLPYCCTRSYNYIFIDVGKNIC